MNTSVGDKEALLRWALDRLALRLGKLAWAAESHPQAALHQECLRVSRDREFAQDLGRYIGDNPWVRSSLDMLVTHLATATQPMPSGVQDFMLPVVARGWCLGRWIPTFLVLDGPIGRFITSDVSPLRPRFGPSIPMLTSVRDLLRNQTFKFVRNGFAHWSFDWEVVGANSYVVVYDARYHNPPVRLHREEMEAFHLSAYTITDVIREVFLQDTSPHAKGA